MLLPLGHQYNISLVTKDKAISANFNSVETYHSIVLPLPKWISTKVSGSSMLDGMSWANGTLQDH
ncbi:hypothetical protein MITS9509_02451 [Synechococcus sp. MIT S9509]|nr:hypothetical protein MITS9504_02271 [Synechococcus sp. MIT S9504]KZR91515.1 hypothetical protein MITS9509_02451 [Synechococcus sp. MIT S9509]